MNLGIEPPQKVHRCVHYQQRHHWDCGVSCCIMILDDDRRRDLVKNFDIVCQAEGFGKSTWTVDLCYLLKRYDIDFLYTTTTLGVDPGYSDQSFYSGIMGKDTARVNGRFSAAAESGVRVERRSCDLVEILSHVSRYGPVIALTNANVLACGDSSLNLAAVICGVGAGSGGASGSSGSKCCAKRAYQGHYILVVGYDVPARKVIYRNPSVRDGESAMSFECFEDARTCYGTDEDLIFVFMNSGKVS